MTTLTIMPEGKTVDAPEGASLYSLMGMGEPEGHKCSDKCHVFVLEGRKGLSKITGEENGKLDMIVGASSKSRYACSATILGTEDVTVEVLDFV